MQVADEKVVSIHYTLTDESGTTIDSSRGGEPLEYLHGAGNIVPGLEQALAGKEAGDHLNVDVPPAEAYGDRQEGLLQAVPISAFQGAGEVQPGMRFRAEGPDGSRIITVAKVEDDQVTVDANHPLAGVTLSFDVEVVEVRNAKAEEIEHGHVHDPQGHQ